MAYSVLQSKSAAATGTSGTKAATFTTANLTSGTKIIAAVALSCNGNAITITGVADGSSNNLTLIGRKTVASTVDVSLWAMDTPSGDVGTKPTITATASNSSGDISILIQEVSGLLAGNTTAMADGTLGSKSGTGGASTGSPTYSSTATAEYLVSVYGDDGGPETWTKPTSTTSDTNSINTNSHADCALAWKDSTNGAEAGSWALSGTSADWATLLVAFKLGGGTTYDADVSKTFTATTTATGLLKPAVAAASKTFTETTTATGLLKPAVAAATETFTATVTADATVTAGTIHADVSKTFTETTTATGLLKPAVAGASETATATTTATAKLKPAVAAVSKTFTATTTATGLLKPAVAAVSKTFTATVTADAILVTAGTFPILKIQAQFTTGTWTDITSDVRSGTITRPATRLQGPVVQYQAGTATLTLKNATGDYDPDNAAGPYWGGTASRTATFTSTDTFTPPVGVTSLDSVECWAAGGGGGNDPSGGGNDGGGGGGGEYAKETSVAVTALKAYTVTVGAAGAGGAASSSTQHNGSAGGNTSFPGDAVTVTAHGGGGGNAGAGGSGTAGTAGTGSSNTTHHNGGAGAAGTGSAGGGGGSSAGTAAAGNAGSGATAGAAVTGGGPGGTGANGTTQKSGGTPANGPGGGGGGGDNGAGGAGQGGQVKITYTVSVAQTQVLPMVPIQIQAAYSGVTYTLFTGYVDAWTDDGTNYAGNYDEVILTATDAFKVFSNVTLDTLLSPAGAGEDSGARASRILDAASWSPTARAITTGDTTLQATTLGDTVMNILQLTADTELGELYVDGSGNLTFRHRLGLIEDARSNTPQGVFGDSPGTSHTAGTELAYTQVSRAEDDTTLVNDAQITIAGGSNLQEAIDSDSIAQFLYPRTYQRTDLLLQSDSDGLNYAQWIVYIGSDAENRFDVLTITPAVDATNLYPQALGREFGDRIEVWRRPPNVSAISKDCFIRGITHSFTPLFWQTQWTLQSASKYGSFLTLDDPTLGKLDQNALAY